MPLRVIKRLTIVVPANRTGLASNIIVRLSVRAASLVQEQGSDEKQGLIVS